MEWYEKVIQKLDELDKENQDIIDSITQEEECNNDQELDADQTRNDKKKKKKMMIIIKWLFSQFFILVKQH